MLQRASHPQRCSRSLATPAARSLCAFASARPSAPGPKPRAPSNTLGRQAAKALSRGRSTPLRLSRQHSPPTWVCNSGVAIVPVPSDLRLEVKPEDGSTAVEYDEENKVVRIPLSALGPEGQRRSKLVLFTCNKCGGRTARLVNPIAWEQGVVYGQCGKCEVWHVLAANNKQLYEEVRYKDDPRYADMAPPQTDVVPDAVAGEGAGEASGPAGQ